MKVRFLPEAEAELIDAAHWYRQQAPGLDQEFLRCVDQALANVGRMPRLFPVIHRQLRRALVRRFPYAIFFSLNEEEVVIYAVFHCRMDPRHITKGSR